MKIQSIALVTVFATFVSATAPTAVLAAGPEASLQTITPAFAHAITNVPGKTLTALVVTYPPGGKTPPHRHGQAFVVGYVLEGLSAADSITAKLRSSMPVKAGRRVRAFITLSENASETKPAKLLALFIADAKQKDLVIVDPR